VTRPLASLALAALALPAVLAAQGTPSAAGPDSAARWAVADALADSAPAGIERSVASLAAYLARAGGDDSTRARALYRWVAGHIGYDVEGFRNGRPGDPSADSVLVRRTSVCQGFATLAEALGAAMGLEIHVVSGWSKGYGYTAGQTFAGPPNHAWDAVRVAGAWRLMDPTWGAGYLDESLQFVRRFQDHYFLTDPAEFVFDHLPEDARWQLLDRPVTAAEYADLVYLRPMFFQAGLRIGSRAHLVLAANGPLAVTLGVTRPVEMTAQLIDAASQRPLDGRFAFVQAGTAGALIAARFPRPGDYLLRVFAKPLGAAGSLEWILDYRVHATGAPGVVFPMAFEAFATRSVRLLSPLDGELRREQRYRFTLRAPGALEVAVVSGGRWTRLPRSGDDFDGEVTAMPGTVSVYAKYDARGEYEGLLRYEGR